MKPQQVFVFIVVVLLLLGGISAIFPEGGITLREGLKLDFPGLKDIFSTKQAMAAGITHILDEGTASAQTDTTRERQIADSLRKIQLQIQYPDGDKSVLYPFFKELDKAHHKKVRVMHYGDSQIEGDRMTSYIRNALQVKFGGYGPGMIPATQFVRSLSINQEASENWKRYTIFGKKDTSIKHNRYGVLGSFARFIPADRMETDTTMVEAWLKMGKSRLGYGRTRSFSYCKMFFGNNNKPVLLKLEMDGQTVNSEILWPDTKLKTITWHFSSTPERFTLRFKGRDSPDIYGFSLENKTGVAVDNIAMRGSAGTIFSKMDRELLRQMYDTLDVKLLIMQFGGNVMPYIRSEKKCDSYGRWFESQLRRLKALIPGVCIIVIGPSDMSVKEQGNYITYPYLEAVRDAMKQAAFNTGSAFWDMYEAMGGENSMPAWVKHDPPLAASDYTHFSPSGIKKIAQWFNRSLMEDYAAYKSAQQAK
ncbi:MAG: GDSL-type esterase/lipase family protein [Flavobacteriales bacterium]